MKFDVPTVVMGKIFENGYEDQIIDIVMAFETDPSKEVSDIHYHLYLLGIVNNI